MATQVQFRRGTTSQNNAFTGAQGELTIDTDVWTIRIHDGTTAGGKQVPTLSATQTFTNKTMGSNSVWNGNAIGLGYGGTGAALSGVAGAIAYSTGSALALSLAGTSGQVLTSGGTSGPTWVNASALSTGTATTATTATNIAGGSAGYLVYQQDTDTTSFIAPGTSGYILKSTGASTAPSWVTSTVTIGTTSVSVGESSTSFAGLNILAATGTSHWTIPVGTTAQRPGSPAVGMIRYNSSQSTFEGYSSGAWSSLGGVKSVDALTYIIAETSAGASNGELEFYTENAAGDTAVKVGGWNYTRLLEATGTVVGSKTTQNVFNTVATTVNAFGAATTLSLGASTGTTTINNDVVVSGNLTVNGTTTTINATTISVDDKNIELGSVASPTNTTADGGGITLKGTTDKSFNWVNATSAWTSSEHIALAAGKTLVVGGSSSGTTTVQAEAAASGTLTLPAATDTLVGKATTDTLTNKTISLTNNTVTFTSLELKTACSDETGSGSLVFATSPTLVTPTLGVASATTINKVTITAPATGSTLTIADGKTLTASNSLTFTGTDSTSFAFPGTSDTVVTLTATQTLTNKTLNSPTMTTPTLGVASATSINKVVITAPATSATLTIADGKTLTASNSLTFTGTDSSSVAFGAGGTVVYTSNKLSALSSTSSSELAGVISDETGSGSLVFATSPTLVTPILGTPQSVTLTNATGLPVSTGISGFGTGVATFLATPSSANLLSAVTDETGSGALVFGTSPAITTSLTTPSTSFALVNTTATTVNFAGAATTLSIGASSGTTTINNDTVITGNLTVNGTTTTINATTITVDDINIELGSVATPTDVTAAGGGITLKGATDKTITWGSTNGWTSSETFNIASGKTYKINGTDVLSSTTLGSGVTGSSLTSVGTIGTGTWQGSVISSTYGGTGINNGGRTITLNTGNLTLTAQAAGSSVTVPASGTLATTADTTYIGTTAVTLSRASANLALTGISSVTLPGSTSGTVQIIPTAAVGTGTVLTIPATTGTIVTTGDSGTVTNTMLAGSIANAKLTNSSVTVGTTAISLGSSSTTLAGLTSVSSTSFTGALTGNASTATTLATARAIYGNNFDGSAALTQIIASTYGGTGNGFTKFSGATTTEKTYTLPDATCTILTSNSAVTAAQGGTGQTSYTVGDLLYASTTTALSKLAASTSGYVLTSGGAGVAPSWAAITVPNSSTQVSSLGVGTAASGTSGEIRATNAITSYYSDDKLKTNLGNIPNALEKVLSLNGFYYEANETAQALGYAAKKEVGVSAQQVQAVLPEVVVPAPIDEQYLTVHYERLVPLLIEAIKEQQKQIDELKAKLGK